MNIYTLTLLAAFDRYCVAKSLQLYQENLVWDAVAVAGGKGINLSRALQSVDVPSTAIAVLGKENGERFTAQAQGICPVWCEGRIRENITIATPKGETRISFEGAPVPPDVIAKAFAELGGKMEAGDILALGGRLPKGVAAEEILPYLLGLQCKGILLVIDSKSFSLADIVRLSPWLIKPNEEEISAYCGREIHSLSDALSAAKELHQKGIQNVMVSLGDKGAVLVSDKDAYTCKAPTLSVRSTVGAGDSSIAGFIYAHVRGLSDADKLRYAVAFGSAACLQESSLPPKKVDIENIYNSL